VFIALPELLGMSGNNTQKKAGGKGRPPGMPNLGNLLSLERPPALAPKYANQIGKTSAGYSVCYSMDGVTVMVKSLLSENGEKINIPSEGIEKLPTVSVAEWERRRALHNAPSEKEKASAMVRKYELRLKKECKSPPASGSDADIQAWLGKLPFKEKLALLQSQKDFNKSYPEGFRD